MKKLFRGALVAVAAAGLFASFAPAASAQEAGVAVFVGSATTPPLGYPLLGAKTGGGVGFNSTTCVDSTGSTSCQVSAGGTITGAVPGVVGPWCGHSTGTVNGTATLGNGQGVSFTATFVTAGSVVVVAGLTNGGVGAVAGVGLALPPTPVTTPGQSCLSGTARDFTLVMAAGFAEV